MGQTVEVNQEVMINGTFLQELTKNDDVFCICAVMAHPENNRSWYLEAEVTSSKYQLKAFKRLNTFFFIDTSKNLAYLLQTHTQTLLLYTWRCDD